MKNKKENEKSLKYLYSKENIENTIKRMHQQDDWDDFVKSMQALAKM